jgi:glycosyltransferase involved in cell wall biosynthesis
VLCVSAKTADDLKALTGKTDAQVRMIYNPLNWNFRPGAAFPADLVSRLGLKPGQPYLLHVGGNVWYKNRPGLLRIFARLAAMEEFSTAVLVLAGKPCTAALRTLIREQRLGQRVIEATNVSNEELQALYGNALALLFPSLEEGFGWPVLEAQACGCPVITTGRPPMSEVAGEAAIFIDPADPEAAAAAIAAGLQRREQLRAAGFRNVERFDQEAIVDQYCAFYEAILGDKPAPAR